MRILVLHNYYQLRGGEDAVFEAESELLRGAGHEVETFAVHNDDVAAMGPARTAMGTIWNRTAYRQVSERCRQFRPEVAHFHNTVPLLSPAAYFAARRAGAAVVQTLHNYRLACVNALFFRDGHVCQDCLGRTFAIPGIRHRCYRGSRSASTALAIMLSYHRARGTWNRAVDRYIALTDFGKAQFVRHGLPEDKIAVKPNFPAEDPGTGTHDGEFGLYVGRLSVEKGVQVLADAWSLHPGMPPLKVVGDGPLSGAIERAVQVGSKMEWLGSRPRADVFELMRQARFLVLPSVCYEGFPLSLVEAMSAGLPAIVSGHGAMADVVEHQRTGIHFDPGRADSLADAVRWAADHLQELTAMGGRCRTEYEKSYTPASSLRKLEEIYLQAVEIRQEAQ